jgi:hypothetical protein
VRRVKEHVGYGWVWIEEEGGYNETLRDGDMCIYILKLQNLCSIEIKIS